MHRAISGATLEHVHDGDPFCFATVSRRRAVLLAMARRVPYVNHRPSVDALLAAAGAAAGAVGAPAGVPPLAAVPGGVVTAFAVAALCNLVKRLEWRGFGGPARPPDAPGDPGGDFEPRDPLVPAGAGAAALTEPVPENDVAAVCALFRPRGADSAPPGRQNGTALAFPT